jgi:NAD(P)-dependent dehydrogenase (short-subunit alcohol dehydrogenase family)
MGSLAPGNEWCVAAVEQIGSRATGVQADTSVLADLDRLFDTISDQARRVDVLFANAGVGGSSRAAID